MSSNKQIPVVKWLKVASTKAWLDQANQNPLELLIDHAHCERKAAGFALQLMFRYLCEPGLAEALSPLVREELEHFELVLSVIKKRGRYLEPLPAPPYGSVLAGLVRKGEPERMLDSFLVAGLIEARSHERMSILAAFSTDNELRELYSKLLESEARHFNLYWHLSIQRYDLNIISDRMNHLASVEAEIISNLHPFPRMHS